MNDENALVAAATLIIIFLTIWFISNLFSPFLRKAKKPWRVKKSRQWLKQFRATKNTLTPLQRFGYVRGMKDPFLFEEVLMTCFEDRERVKKVTRTKYSRDGGLDGVIYLPGDTLFVQAKLYTDPIKRRHVIDFKELLQKKPGRVGKGLFIHTGKTSEPIKRLVWQSEEIEMISGVNKLLALLDGEPLRVFGHTI